MRKTLLFGCALLSLFANGQTLIDQNFNTFVVGNLGTDINGTIPGQGGFFTIATNGTDPTTSNNAAAENFQIVANGNNNSNGLLIQTPNGDKGGRLAWQEGFGTLWAARTTGNDIVEVEYDLFTGPATDNVARVEVLLRGENNGNTVINAGMAYLPNSRVLEGIAYLNADGFIATFNLGFGEQSPQLETNTWYRVGFSYNYNTGVVLWKGVNNLMTSSLIESSYWIPNSTPTRIDFRTTVPTNTGTTNATTSNVIFDNLNTQSVANNTLAIENVENSNEISMIYPNPVVDQLHFKQTEDLKHIAIFDINGRNVMRTYNRAVITSGLDVSNLVSGVYIVVIESSSKVYNTKFIKK